MNRFFLLLLLSTLGLGMTTALYAQRQNRPLHNEPDYLNKGWSFSLGATTMVPWKFSREASNGNLYNGKLFATPKVGWEAACGRMRWSDKYRFIDFWEWGGRYFALRGMERFNGDWAGKSGGNGLSSDSKTKYNLHSAGAYIRIINMHQFADNYWLHHGPSASADYQFIQRAKTKGADIGLPQTMPYPLQVALHYNVGLGKKSVAGVFFVLSLETPVVTAVPLREALPSMTVLSNKWEPVWIHLNMILLDKRPSLPCSNPHQGPEVDKENPGRHAKGGVMNEGVKKARVKRRRG